MYFIFLPRSRSTARETMSYVVEVVMLRYIINAYILNVTVYRVLQCDITFHLHTSAASYEIF